MKKVLVICPFDRIYPPMNGGMKRCFNILNQLAKHFELTAIIHQDKESFLRCLEESPAMATAKIYSTNQMEARDIFTLLPPRWEKAFRSRWYQRQVNRPADGSLIKYYPVLTQLLKKNKFQAIILESLATLNAVKIIRRYDKTAKIIYNAHNVDTILAKAAFERKEISHTELLAYENTESHLYRNVDAIFTCSRDDKKTFEGMNNGKLKVVVVPNGVNVTEKGARAVNKQIPQFLLFCGSLWTIPNAEGLHWFCNKIWPLVLEKYPSLRLLVIGSGSLPEKYNDIVNTVQTEFYGEVPDVKVYYNRACVSVVPILTGSGTRLKILESMAMGVPVVSTSKGAEGIDYTAGWDIIIADDEQLFSKKIIELVESEKSRITIKKNASTLVSIKYNWDTIGMGMAHFINSKLNGN